MNFSAGKYWAALLPLLFGAMLATAAPAAPGGRGAVLQYMNGAVSIQPHGTGSWVAGAVNDPLKNADNVWTDKAARAELNLGTGVLQMNAETSLTLVNVVGPTVQVRLNQGTLYLHVRHLFNGEIYEVDSRDGSFTVTKSGDYRFDVDAKADVTTITVWKGEGSLTSGERPAVRVKAHEQIRLAGAAAAVDRHKAPKPDGFDEWCRLRDERFDSAYPRYYPYPYPPGVVIYGRPGWYWR